MDENRRLMLTQPYREYTVTWVDYDGTVLETDTNVPRNTTPTYDGETPTRAQTAQYTYTFSGWSPTITPVKKDITYTAQYDATLRYYAVYWKNYNGSTLKTDLVAYGTTPSYSGPTPTKPADVQYTYSFSGWSPTPSAIIGDTTYTAQFTQTTRQYTYTFYDDNGSTILKQTTANYGTQIVAPSNPSKSPTEYYTYTFDGWYTAQSGGTKVTSFGTLDANVAYYARYTAATRYYTIRFLNYDSSVLESYSLTYGSTPVYNGNEPVRANSNYLGYTFKGWSPSIATVTANKDYTATYASYVVMMDYRKQNAAELVGNFNYGFTTTDTYNAQPLLGDGMYSRPAYNPDASNPSTMRQAYYKATGHNSPGSQYSVELYFQYKGTGTIARMRGTYDDLQAFVFVHTTNIWSGYSEHGLAVSLTYVNTSTPSLSQIQGYVRSDYVMTIGNWYHVVICFNGNSISNIYVNNSNRTFTSGGDTYFAFLSRMGLNTTNDRIDLLGGATLNTEHCLFRIYNSVLDASFVSKLYASRNNSPDSLQKTFTLTTSSTTDALVSIDPSFSYEWYGNLSGTSGEVTLLQMCLWQLEISPSNEIYTWEFDTPSLAGVLVGSVPNRNFVHVILTITGSYAKWYVNGSLAAQTNLGFPGNTSQGYGVVGDFNFAHQVSSSLHLEKHSGTFNVYNRAATAAEVLELYNAVH